MDYSNIIERNPDILLGKHILKGTRISVELIVRKLSEGQSVDQLIESYPHLNKSQISGALAYAADIIANEDIVESV